MTQNNAHKTAISRKKPSQPMQWLNEQGKLIGCLLDYGCGKGSDAKEFTMDKFDPHFTNNMVEGVTGLTHTIDELPETYDTITCNYVLNVIEDPRERQRVLDNIRYLLYPDGVAYITVRRDIHVQEGYTSKGTYQATVELDLPVEHEVKGKYIIYRLEK